MQISPFDTTTNGANAPTTSSTNATQTPNNQLTGDSFIQLLVAQIQAQDPTSPMDPTQFVTQLVQFNTLQQIINIEGLLQTALTPTTNSSAPTPAKS